MNKKVLNLIGHKEKSRPSKEECQRIHFQKRWKQRVGYILTDKKYEEIRDLVQKTGKFMGKEDSGNSVFRVKIDGMLMLIVYDALARMPITILGWNKKE